MTDSLTIFGDDFTGVTGIKATATGDGTLTYVRPQGTKSISSNGTGIDVTEYAAVDVTVPSSQPNLQAKTNISPTTSSQIVTESIFGVNGSAQIPSITQDSVTKVLSIS